MHVLLGGNRIYVEAALREQRCMIGRGPAHAGLDWTGPFVKYIVRSGILSRMWMLYQSEWTGKRGGHI